MDLMIQPTIATSVIGNFLLGGILFGIETYRAAVHSGSARGQRPGGWPGLDATLSDLGRERGFCRQSRGAVGVPAGRNVRRWSGRRGHAGARLGATFPAWSRIAFTLALVIAGMGMGPVSLSFILAVQHAVKWGQRGVATGAVIFFRTIGGAIGVGVLGGALGWELGYLLVSAGAGGIDVGAALRPETHLQLSAADLALVQSGLGRSLRDVYILMFVLALGTLCCTVWLPGRREEVVERETRDALSTLPESQLAVSGSDV